MKKIFLLLCAFFMTASLFAYDRDYTEIQKKHSESSGQKFLFRDVFGTEFKTVINPEVPAVQTKKECFKLNKAKTHMTYTGDENYRIRLGVDISRHDGEVDWKKLKKDGIEFVVLRCGFRGYQSGKLKADENFQKNIKGAVEAGLDVGVYIFSQADSEKEALEEAALVLKEIKGHKITLPVFYDPEIIRDDPARSDNITGEQFTKNAIVFCEAVKKAGYIPGVYSNMLWEAYEFDMAKLKDYVIWYADYEEQPQSPYAFEFWQYAEKEGDIKAPYDLDVQIIKNK